MLGRALTSSGPRNRRARVIHTPYASASSTISCSRRSSPAMSKERAWRDAGVAGLTGFVDVDEDGVAERSWMWMIGEAACEGIVTASMQSSTARIARMFSCGVLKIDAVFRMMLMPSEAEAARSAGTAAEKTNDVPLIRR